MDVRTQILDEATRLFAAQGVDATSLSAIADAVGIRKASILYHFPSKDALHQSVLDKLLSHWNETLPRLLEAAAGEDRFDALLSETLRFFVVDPDRARLLLREALDRPEDMRERLRSSVQPWVDAIAGYIEKGQAHGELRRDADPQAYLLQVIHLVICGVATAETLGVLLTDGEPGLDRVVRELTRVAKSSLYTDAASANIESATRRDRTEAT